MEGVEGGEIVKVLEGKKGEFQYFQRHSTFVAARGRESYSLTNPQIRIPFLSFSHFRRESICLKDCCEGGHKIEHCYERIVRRGGSQTLRLP